MKRFSVMIITVCIMLSFSIILSGCSSTNDNQSPSQESTNNINQWEKTYYVDEFDNYTNEAYIRNSKYFIGQFSNSATTNSKLKVSILVDKNSVSFKLYEYGSLLVKGYSNTNYSISILDNSNSSHKTTGTLYKNGDRIVLSDLSFINLLKTNSTLKVYVTEDSKYGYNSTYLFNVTRDNFNTAYNKL